MIQLEIFVLLFTGVVCFAKTEQRANPALAGGGVTPMY